MCVCVCVIMVIKMVWHVKGVCVFMLDVSEYSITIRIKDNESAIDTRQLKWEKLTNITNCNVFGHMAKTTMSIYWKYWLNFFSICPSFTMIR